MSEYIKYDVYVLSSGDRKWWVNGKLHREDGPAVEWADGGRQWWVNGKLHREDGPAVEYPDGTRKWYLNGTRLTEAEFNAKMKPSCDGKIVEIDGKKYQLKAI